MAGEGRFSQLDAEALQTGTPKTRISQADALALNQGTPKTRVSQLDALALQPLESLPGGTIRTTTQVLETVVLTNASIRNTTQALEVVCLLPAPIKVTTHALEVVCLKNALINVTTHVLEVIAWGTGTGNPQDLCGPQTQRADGGGSLLPHPAGAKTPDSEGRPI
ncbi:MAG TPA: hypothetical protein VFO16_24110 [Pseudonocardiaceae bacterium]|nr:hypothetical protein [Pseudonocardiaceae bacterium]